MNILITGGAGFIGSNFIRYWMSRYPQDSILNLDKLTYAGNLENLKGVEESPNYQFIKGDITDSKLVNKLTKDIDLIVHFAAESHVDNSIEDPSIFVKTNVLGTQTLLSAAVNNGNIRFHHISTDEVFGSLKLGSRKRFNEKTNYAPNSPYSASKAGSDMLVRAYHETYNLPVTISNCSNNYGPYQHPEKLIPKCITRILNGGKIPMMGDGEAVRDWIFVDDHNKGIETIINNGKLGETYCLGGSNELSIKKVIEIICTEMDVNFDDVVEHILDRKGHDMRYSINHNKITKELGWRPEYRFEKWIKQTIDWYRENPVWWMPLLEDVKY